MDMTFFVFHYLISFLKSIKIKNKKKHQENRCSKNAKCKIIEDKRYKKKSQNEKRREEYTKDKKGYFFNN